MIVIINILYYIFTVIFITIDKIYLIDYYVEAQWEQNIYVAKIQFEYLLKLINSILINDVDTNNKILILF